MENTPPDGLWFAAKAWNIYNKNRDNSLPETGTFMGKFLITL